MSCEEFLDLLGRIICIKEAKLRTPFTDLVQRAIINIKGIYHIAVFSMSHQNAHVHGQHKLALCLLCVFKAVSHLQLSEIF